MGHLYHGYVSHNQRVYEYMMIYVYVAYAIVLRLCTCTYVWMCVNVYERYCGNMDSINTCMICIYVPAPTNPSNLQCIAIHTTVMHHIPQVIDSKSSTWEIPRGIYRICFREILTIQSGWLPQKNLRWKTTSFSRKSLAPPLFPMKSHSRWWNPFDFVWERATRKKKLDHHMSCFFSNLWQFPIFQHTSKNIHIIIHYHPLSNYPLSIIASIPQNIPQNPIRNFWSIHVPEGQPPPGW